MTLQNQVELKQEAALKALEFVQDGMVVGLGTGSTATLFVEALAERVKQGLNIVGVATSEHTEELAKQLGITVSNLAKHHVIDLTVDGADEVELPSLNLVKGLGGALLREKIVACSSKTMIVVVDETKLVTKLGSRGRVPVEIIPFGFETTIARLKSFGAVPHLREGEDGKLFITDGGHFICDCAFPPIEDAPTFAKDLKSIVGVVETGLFISIATHIVAAKNSGIELISR